MSEQFPTGASRIPTDAQRRNARDKGTLGLKNKPKRPPRTPKWSHQHDLEAGIGKLMVVTFAGSENELEGKLIAADQYAIKLLTPDSRNENGDVIFKHDIGSFRFEG